MSDETRDNAAPPPPAQDGVSNWRMIMAMGTIGLLAGVLIVLTYTATFPVIERNKAAANAKDAPHRRVVVAAIKETLDELHPAEPAPSQ